MSKVAKCFILLFLGLAATSAIFVSCTDVDKTLGLGFVPNEGMHNFKTDTLYPEAYTVIQDSIYTHSSGTLMIGTHYDPMFGLTTSGSAFQFSPSRDSVKFGVNPVYKSLILKIPINGDPIGNAAANQTFTVYELKERIYLDSGYYACAPIASMIKSTPIVTHVYKGEDTLQIELGADLAERLLKAPEDVMILADTMPKSKFFDHVKGLYIVASSSRGEERMNYFSPYATINLSYSNNVVADTTLSYTTLYWVDSDYTPYYFAQFNTVERDYNQADPAWKVKHLLKHPKEIAATALDSVVYVQGFFGATPYIKINANSLKNWLQEAKLQASQATIVRAELVMEIEEFSGFDLAEYPNALGGMTLLNPLTSYHPYYGPLYIAGYLSSFYYSADLFNGLLSKTHKKYSFGITHEILDQLKKNVDLEFYLTPYMSNAKLASSRTLLYNIGPTQYKNYRAVLKGSTSSKPPMLFITYEVPQ